MALPSTGYLKGKAGHWFWPVAGMLALMFVWPIISPMLYPPMAGRAGLSANVRMIFIAAGIQTFFYAGTWVMTGLAYGLSNKIKAFKVLFLVVAGIQLLGFYEYFMSALGRYNIMYVQDQITYGGMALIRVFSLLQSAAWVTFAIFTICHPKTGGVLRGAAIVLAAARIIALAYTFGFSRIVVGLAYSRGMEAAASAVRTGGLIMSGMTLVSLLFFFGAMSFSRMKGVPQPEESELPQA